MFNTPVCNNGCLTLTRKAAEGETGLSNEEICWYKQIDPVEFEQHRLRAQSRIERLTTLMKYVDWIEETGRRRDPESDRAKALASKLLKRWPLKIEELRVRPWHVKTLFCPLSWAKFRREFEYKQLSHIRLHHVLFLNKAQLHQTSEKVRLAFDLKENESNG